MDSRPRRRVEELIDGTDLDPEFIRAGLDHLDQGISILDGELRMALANKRFGELLGFPSDLLEIGTPLEDYFRFNAERGEYGDGDVEEMVAERMALAAKREAHCFERTRPDGVVLRIEGRPLPNGGFVTTYTDVTEEKRTAEALRRSTSVLKGLLDHSPSMIVVRDAAGRFRLLNRAYEKMFQVTEEDAIGKTPRECMPAEFADDLEDFDSQVIETGEPMIHEHRAAAKYGGGTFFAVRFPIKDEYGKVAAVGAVITDVTGQKKMEAQFHESEERFSKAFHASPGLMSISELESGRYIDVNEAYLTVLGFARDELIGKTSYELDIWVDDGDREKIKTILRDEGALRNFETRLRMKSGEIRDFLLAADLIEWDGRDHLLGIGFDVTERKRAENLLWEQQKQFQDFIDNAPAEYTVKDLDGTYLMVNKAFCEAGDLKREDAIGRNIRDMIAPAEAEAALADERRAAETGSVVTGEREVVLLGQVRTYRATKFPIFDAAGDVAAVGSINADITEQKRIEEDLQKALVAAEEANHAKSQFLATMSHELRTPLNAILGFTEILHQQYFGPLGEQRYEEYVGDIMTSGRHLLDLINDVLDLSTIEAGAQALNAEDLDLSSIVADCSSIVAEQATRKGLNFAIDMPSDLPPLRADRRAVTQILINLLSNAVKYTAEGGDVALAVEASDGHHTIRVSDTGEGVPAAKLANLTDPFLRAENDPYKSQDGTGLGLTIVEALVDLHDGRLDIESELGDGTTVTVSVPSNRA